MSLFNEEKILTHFKAKSKDAIELAICFPNTYSVGISSLGFQTAWKLFNQNENVKAVRWFTDIEEKTRKPALVGFSFSWELDYKNILHILEKNNIPIYAKDRTSDDPLVFAGGQVINANPEPFCDFFDFFLVGDLEEIADDFIRRCFINQTPTRDKTLKQLSEIPGIYVPSLQNTKTKKPTTKNNLAYSSILTPNSVWPNTFLIEVVRSCPELCRFCLASFGSLPFRTPSVKESLIPLIDFGLKHTNKIGLLGASVTQHPRFEELVNFLLTKENIKVQVASVRVDTISKSLAEGLLKLGAKSITMAVETGSKKLRDTINKKVSNETIFNSIQTIYDAGFKQIKLYGMVGLPFETDDDLKQTIDLLKEIKLKNKTKKLVWSSSIFVPKATTPYFIYGMDKSANKKLKFLKKELHQIGVDFRHESFKWSCIQALISRGDRSINKTLVKAYRYGNTIGAFNRAIKEEKIDFKYFVFSKKD